MLQPKIETIPAKKLMGKKIQMSLADNKTRALFQSFMPGRHQIKNKVNADVICMQVYNTSLNFKDFTPNTVHQKWAAVEVTDFNLVPDDMEIFTLQGGMYAVFLYKGAPAAFGPTFNYIFNTWLPASLYEVDNRPHFEILGEKYKNDDPGSEEEIWVPIRLKLLS
ncbi:GyrI-like domain-containing protein [Mucilaginibacter sp.]|uniref:GyrI-like domain-containing protein n=1 Tax=Mucilaginibacter sp. TaxID=1882438 RepID=UPI00262B44C5|nr:GyrI-like domain-containing protein [Mucilaginibacter sp.]